MQVAGAAGQRKIFRVVGAAQRYGLDMLDLELKIRDELRGVAILAVMQSTGSDCGMERIHRATLTCVSRRVELGSVLGSLPLRLESGFRALSEAQEEVLSRSPVLCATAP